MALPDAKALKQLVKACRKLGIKHYKCNEFEFTLSDDEPVSNYKKKQRKSIETSQDVDPAFQSESLTEDQLLFWSSAEIQTETGETAGN